MGGLSVVVNGYEAKNDSDLADTIMIGVFRTKEKTASLISVPRDTYYERSEFKSSSKRIRRNSGVIWCGT